MSRTFNVEKAVLHFVSKDKTQLSDKEFGLADFQADDAAIISNFFDGHLNNVWDAAEGRATCSGHFTNASEMKRYYEDGKAKLFDNSCAMAELLHQKSKGTKASPGILMVLWLGVLGDTRNFLALLKMDPGRADKIALSQSDGGLLLKLAVRHIEQALPDPGDQVLKWAITPHPNRLTFDVKVRDEEGKAEPAQYFMKFLGCTASLSERKQIETILTLIPAYTEQHHPRLDARTVVPTVLDALEDEPVITPEVIVSKLKESKAYTGFEEKTFRKELEKAQIVDLSVSSSAWRATRLQYRLPNGIIIKGPRAVIESQVKIVQKGKETEFRIRTPSYEKTYG